MDPSTNTPAVVVRRVAAKDWEIVRDATLEMFSESPGAFGESVLDLQTREDETWRGLVETWAGRAEIAAFVALDGEGLCGFVRGDLTDPAVPRGTVLVSQLWTAPRQRATGLGRRLMDEVARWAISVGAAYASLGVIETNLHVLQFYERLGYRDAGLRVPLQSDPSKQIVVMMRSLRP